MEKRVSTTVTHESQISLPEEVRERLRLAEGSVVTFVLTDNDVMLLGAPQSIDDLFGSVPALAHTTDDFDTEIEDAIETALRALDR